MAAPKMNTIVWETNFPGIHFHRARQSARHLRGRRPPADRRHRPPFGLRRGPAHADSRQGPRADAAFAVLVRSARDVMPNHILSATDFPARSITYRTNSKAAPCSAANASRCRSNASCAATSPAPAGKTIAPPGKSAASRCRRACANPTGCLRSCSHPRPRPATGHDENISFEHVVEMIGDDLAERVRAISLDIYRRAAAYAEPRGIILADTKFEFGLLNGELIWIDEALTPDSSRFWPAAGYQPGRPTALVRQAVCARLPRTDRVELKRPRARTCPPMWLRPHARNTGKLTAS